jgi:hypothetical protein
VPRSLFVIACGLRVYLTTVFFNDGSRDWTGQLPDWQ